MGQRGIATSFYTERDEPIASVLVRTLLETKQEVPEFLEPFKPTGKGLENLKFETESDFDPEEAGVAHLGISSGDGGWSNEGYGGDDDTAAAAAATGDDAAWGGGGGGGGDASAGGNSAWGGASDNTGNEIKKEEPQAASVWESSAGGSAW